MAADGSEQISLETERLLLRRPVEADVAAIADLLNNWNIASRLGNMPFPYERRHAQDWLHEVEREWAIDRLTFVICLKSDGRVCGVVSLFGLISAQPALGFWLGEVFWGRGLMSEAVAALVSFAFERLNTPQLGADQLLDNAASGRVLEKCGFVESERSLLWSRAQMSYVSGRSMILTRARWSALNG